MKDHNSESAGVDRPKVILFDWWKTMGTAECETWENRKEPIVEAQILLGLGHRLRIVEGAKGPTVLPDDDFLRFALTQKTKDPEQFLDLAARRYGCHLKPGDVAEFQHKVLAAEEGSIALYGDVKTTLKALQTDQGFRLGVISNLWGFPAERIFGTKGTFTGVEGLNLGRYFEHLICSYEVGHSKPDREIFDQAAHVFGVAPSDCLVVGDNLEFDIRAALNAGMRAAFIDRARKYTPEKLEALFPGAGVILLHQLTDLLPLLGVSSESR